MLGLKVNLVQYQDFKFTKVLRLSMENFQLQYLIARISHPFEEIMNFPNYCRPAAD